MPLTPVLTKRFGTNQPWKIDNYEALDGYAGAAQGAHAEPGLADRTGQGTPTCAAAAAPAFRPA